MTSVATIRIPAQRIRDARNALAQAEVRARRILAQEKAKSLKGLYLGHVGSFGRLGSTAVARKIYSGATGAVEGGTAGAAIAAGAVTAATTVGTALGIGTATAAGGAAAGAAAGATVGSVVPIVGTAIGAIVGILASGVLSSHPDPENANFVQAVNLYNTQGPNAIYNIADKYLVLAGLFDLHPSQISGNIPIYRKFGRMGEYKFVTAMCNLIYAAEQAGKITNADTPSTIFNNIVLPWINSFGFGQGTDKNWPMIETVITGMIAEYVTGMQSAWRDVNGNYTFKIPNFVLPVPTAGTTSAASTAGTAQMLTGTPQITAGMTPIQAAGVLPASGTAGLTQIGTDPTTGVPIYRENSTGTDYEYVNGQLTPYNPTMTTASGAPTTGGLTPSTMALIQSLLAQGQSQTQAYTSALQSLAAQGVNTSSPAVQAQVAQAVQAPSGTVAGMTAGTTGVTLTNPAILIGLGLLGIGVVLYARGDLKKFKLGKHSK